jgi:hypothetical protein
MKWTPPWETAGHSAAPVIPGLLWNPKVYYRVNSVKSNSHPQSRIFNIYINIILPFTPRSLMWPLPFMLIYIYIYNFRWCSTRTAHLILRYLMCVTYCKLVFTTRCSWPLAKYPIKRATHFRRSADDHSIYSLLLTRQVWNRPGTKIFLFLSTPRVALGPIQLPIQSVPRIPLQELMGPQREAYHPPPASAEVKSTRSLLSG